MKTKSGESNRHEHQTKELYMPGKNTVSYEAHKFLVLQGFVSTLSNPIEIAVLTCLFLEPQHHATAGHLQKRLGLRQLEVLEVLGELINLGLVQGHIRNLAYGSTPETVFSARL